MSSGKRLNTLSFVLGAAAGAGLMALIDPGRGSWRRNQIRQKAVRGVHVAGREGRKRWQRAVDNFRGGLAEARAKILRGERERICRRLDRTRGVRNYLVDVEEVAEGELQRRTG